MVLLISGWIMMEFYGWKDTIVAAIIAFVGAIFGGAITYIGVNRTLKHRDREIFFSNATEKLMIFSVLIDTYSKYLNKMYIYENLLQHGEESMTKNVLETIKELHQQLINDREYMYKSMDYDAIEIVEYHKKSIGRYIVTEKINKYTAEVLIGDVRDIYAIFDNSKRIFEEEYRKFRKNV